VRSISGSKGSEKNHTYVIEDPRTIFYLPEDKQIIVYFEWDGPLGLHHLEGLWKNPEGKVQVISDFDYESKQKRFAGFFTLTLSEAMEAGVWGLEVHVDGETAGTHNFQVVVSPRPPISVSRPLLGPSEVYKAALPTMVSVERFDAQRQRVGSGSGFILEQNWIVTSFENIHGANSVRVVLADGTGIAVVGVAAWNRREDWAILKMPTPAPSSLSAAKPDSWQVGDRCFSLDSPQEGGRTIVDLNITGSHKFPQVGDRLNLNASFNPRASGSPLINEYGEVIGMVVSSSLVPGIGSLATLKEGNRFSYPGNLFNASFGVQLAIPFSLVQLPDLEHAETAFAEMFKTSQFPEGLVKNENLMQGTIGKSIRRSDSQMEAEEQKFEFQRKDGSISVLITWQMQSKLKSVATLSLYDIDNKPIGTAKPSKLNFGKGHLAYSTWTFDVSQLPLGLYRADLVLDASPVWRSFFRLVE